MEMRPEWDGFKGGKWLRTITVRNFIQNNFTPYEGDESFLCGPTDATKKLWDQVMDLSRQEREAGGVLDMDKMCIRDRFSMIALSLSNLINLDS